MAGQSHAQEDKRGGRSSRDAFTSFLHHEAAGGVVLGIATLAALLISNSPWRELYTDFTRHAGHGRYRRRIW